MIVIIILFFYKVTREIFELKQDSIRAAVMVNGPINVAADGRCDSPGHCALYGVTTMMDFSSKLIIESQLIKVNITSLLVCVL